MEYIYHTTIGGNNDSFWKDYYRLREQLCSEDDVTFHYSAIEDLKKDSLSNANNPQFTEFVIQFDNECVGRLFFNKNLDSKANFIFHLLRNQQQNRRIFDYVNELVKDYLLKNNLCEINTQTRIKFLSDYYLSLGSMLMEETQFFSYEVNESEIIERNLPKSLSQKFELKYFEFIPNEHVRLFVNLWNELKKDVPRINKEFNEVHSVESFNKLQNTDKERKINYLTILVFDQESLIGLSYVFYNLLKPHYVYQKLTGIKKGYRRIGLGKELKKIMNTYIIKANHNVKEIKTASYSVNLPMIKLNLNLGFKNDYSVWHHKIILTK